MDKQPEIIICMGSSCFARGNKNIPPIVDNYLKEHKLKGKITFKGQHCTDNCHEGPVIIINNNVIKNVSAENIIAILNDQLNL